MDLFTLVIAFSCFIIGVAAGALLLSRFSNEQHQSRELQKHLHDSQDALKNYKLEVNQHFTETARLLKQMAESYRDVHNHLAQGAQSLASDGSNTPLMQKLPEIDSMASVDDNTARIAPPLDYAPKTSPYDRSTLTEEYDLEKVELAEKPISDIGEAIAANARKPG